MSLNIGNDGINAVRALRTHPAWADLVKGLAEECRKKTVSALEADRKSTRLNSSHRSLSRMPSSA